MKNKDIIVNQAEQIVRLNNEIDRLKKQTYSLKKHISEDMTYVNTSMAEIKDKIDKNEISIESFNEVYKKIYLRIMLWIEGYPKIRITNEGGGGHGEVNNNTE